MNRRSVTPGNRLRRLVWPTPMPLFLSQRIAPAAIGVLMVVYALWASPPDLFGIVPVFPTVGVCAVICLAGAVWLKLRPLVLSVVTVVEMGLSMTLLMQGSGLDIPRTSELLGSSLHGTLWLVYLSAHINAETIAHLMHDRDAGDG